MPTPRGGGAAAVIDNKIYVGGGRPPGGADFAAYDPKADRWTKLPDLPTQRNPSRRCFPSIDSGCSDTGPGLFLGSLKDFRESSAQPCLPFRQQIELCGVVGLLQDFSPWVVFVHRKQYLLKAIG